MKKITLILSFGLLSLNLFSSECSSRLENLEFSQLEWFTGSNYSVESSVQNVNGVLCVGFSRDRKIKRVHYFDDLGTVILKDAKELYKKDVIFFSRDIMPAVVKPIARKEDPMSLSLKDISKDRTQFKLKFVENIMKGFSRTRIREIIIDLNFSLDRPIFTHKGLEFDEFNILVSNMMKVKRVTTYLQGKKVQSYKAISYDITKRKY